MSSQAPGAIELCAHSSSQRGKKKSHARTTKLKRICHRPATPSDHLSGGLCVKKTSKSGGPFCTGDPSGVRGVKKDAGLACMHVRAAKRCMILQVWQRPRFFHPPTVGRRTQPLPDRPAGQPNPMVCDECWSLEECVCIRDGHLPHVGALRHAPHSTYDCKIRRPTAW